MQLDGIGAAISNLQFFHRSIDKSYLQLEVRLPAVLSVLCVPSCVCCLPVCRSAGLLSRSVLFRLCIHLAPAHRRSFVWKDSNLSCSFSFSTQGTDPHLFVSSTQEKLREQQSKHTALIDNFDASLRALSAVPLHPALRAAIEDYQGSALGSSTASATSASAGAAGAGAAGGAGATGTLLDCIPVDRERVFLSQCAANHRKVST